MPVASMATLAIAAAGCVAVDADPQGNDGEQSHGAGAPGTVTLRWSDPVEVAAGAAFRGPWRMNRSEFDFVDDPTVAINDAGSIGVAWADHPEQDIFFQIYSPDGKPQLDEPVNVSRSPRIFSWLPKMVLSDDEPPEIHLLWQDIVFSGGSHGGEIFYARSTDGGESFRSPVNLSNTTAGAGKGRLTSRNWHNGSLDVAVGPQGTVYAAWTEYEGALWFSRSTDGGESFSEPMRLAGGPGENPARGPDLAVDGEGVIYLAWTIGEDSAADVRFARSDDEGRSFSEPILAGESDGHADAPKIAVDSRGTVHLVYAESPGGMFGGNHVLSARLKPGSDSFDEPRDITGAHRERFQSVGFPALDIDGEDNLYILWELYPSARPPGGRPLGLGMTHSSDGGETFAAPSIVPGTDDRTLGFSGSQQGLLMRKLAVNEAGSIAVVNSFFRQNHASSVRLFRGQATRAE